MLNDFVSFVSDFMRVPSELLPKDNVHLVESFISEAYRFALSNNKNDDGVNVPMHGISLRNWVRRKVTSVLEYYGQNSGIDSIIDYIISDDTKPNLEFVGDVMRLSNGYFFPSPSRIIDIPGDNLYLVSGKPTSYLPFSSIGLRILGMSRMVPRSKLDEIRKTGIPILSKEEYTGNTILQTKPIEFLLDCIDNFEQIPWRQQADTESYSGGAGGNVPFIWGSWRSNPAIVSSDKGQITLLRASLGRSGHYYILRFISRDNEIKYVRVPNLFWKRVCLAIDAAIGIRRLMSIYVGSKEISIKLDFVPPLSEMRLIYLLGGRLGEFEQNKVKWKFDQIDVSSLREIGKNLWLEIHEESI